MKNNLKNFIKNNSKNGNFVITFAAFLYLLSGGLTGVFYGSNFANIMLPITVYIFFALLIRHLLKNEEEKRLNDLNDVSLSSYGISYISYGLIYKFIELPYKDDYFMKGSIFLLLLILFIFIMMPLLFKFSNKEWWNNKTSSEKDEQ